MDIDEALTLLRNGQQGIQEWNCRRKAGEEVPPLEGADLADLDLRGVFFGNMIIHGDDDDWIPDFESFQTVNLTGANLRRAVLIGSDLCGAVLDEAILERANLDEADLSNASFRKAKLGSATLRKAKLVQTDCTRADLSSAELEGARLIGTNFCMADLGYSTLRGAEVKSTCFRNCSLLQADLGGIRLTGSELTGANMKDVLLASPYRPVIAQLSDDLIDDDAPFGFLLWFLMCFFAIRRIWSLHPLPFILDQSVTIRTKLPRRCNDPWSILRLSYTGHALAFHFLALIFFLLPNLVYVLFWNGISRLEIEATRTALTMINAAASHLEMSPDPQQREWAQDARRLCEKLTPSMANDGVIHDYAANIGEVVSILARFRRLNGSVARKVAEVQRVSTVKNDPIVERWSDQAEAILHTIEPSLSRRVETRRVWEVVLGLHWGISYFSLSVLLLIYNAGRALLTYRIGPMREEEDRLGETPAWGEYRGLFRIHQAITIMMAVAVASLCFHAYTWLSARLLIIA